MSKSNLFLKYRSKSEKNYYELTDLFNLKPLDVLVMQYLMKMFRKSVDHGKTGKHGKCFYRHDKKFTGFYYGGHYKDMAEHIHAKTTKQSVKNSIKRLQSKGLLYHHKSISNVQIYFPIFDEDVRQSFNDPNYKTIINFNEICKGKNLSHASTIFNFAQDKKLALRKIKNLSCNNVPVSNVPKTNVPKTNVVHRNKQQQTKSRGSNKLPKWFSSKLNEKIGNILINNHKNIKKWGTKIIDIIFKVNKRYLNIKGTDYYSCSNNPYIQNGGLLKSLGDVLVFHAPLESTITVDYSDYIKKNSTLKLKDSVKKQENTGYQPDIDKIEDNLKYYYKHMKQCKKNDDKQGYLKYKEAYNAENENAIDFCNNPFNHDSIEYVDYSKSWINDHNLHKTPKPLQNKVQKQLNEFKERDKVAE